MTAVGIRELKAHLSHYLDSVCRGEEILVTKRGAAIARVVPEPRKGGRLRDELAALAVEGLILLPAAKHERELSGAVKNDGRPVSELVVEDRR